VNDPFALLGVPRRPWIDCELLKQKFLSLSADLHPDRLHHANEAQKRAAQNQFTDLNAAYQSLLDHRERLLCLSELELGKRAPEIQNIPPELMSLFLEVGKLCREADAFLRQKAEQTSPLLKVQLFERAQHSIERLHALQPEVTRSSDALLAEIKQLDGRWEELVAAEKQPRLQRLNEIAGLVNYFKKWNAQIQERIVQLSF